ncbi:hypothetical protein EXN66_Car011018 [Channa argus]|uniref:Uncharacterized protein n=1 Tax=Channa argus TaxID=215402 RepID=A0A6G1PYK1_CHAAH|nr:hypothetical protein EXN66_Car011018 [Channa argus]
MVPGLALLDDRLSLQDCEAEGQFNHLCTWSKLQVCSFALFIHLFLWSKSHSHSLTK